MSKDDVLVNTPSRGGRTVALLQGCLRLVNHLANKLAKPIVVKRLAPIQIPFTSRFEAMGGGPVAARNGGGTPARKEDEPENDGGAGTEDDFVMPGGSAGWGPVSGGYWGLDGQFHTWTGGPPPLPPPLPPFPLQPDAPASGAEDPLSGGIGAPGTTAPQDEAAAEERRRRIRELEEEMHRILEEMQIMWPLLEDLLREQFDARRQEILDLDPNWRPPGVRPPRPDDDEAPPLDPPENQ